MFLYVRRALYIDIGNSKKKYIFGDACLSVTQTVLIVIQFSGFNQDLSAFLGIINALDTSGVKDLVAT